MPASNHALKSNAIYFDSYFDYDLPYDRNKVDRVLLFRIAYMQLTNKKRVIKKRDSFINWKSHENYWEKKMLWSVTQMLRICLSSFWSIFFSSRVVELMLLMLRRSVPIANNVFTGCTQKTSWQRMVIYPHPHPYPPN